jgi:hypothetical protein
VECAKHTHTQIDGIFSEDNMLEPVNLKESENSNHSSKDKDDTGKYPGVCILLKISIVIAVRISNLPYI